MNHNSCPQNTGSTLQGIGLVDVGELPAKFALAVKLNALIDQRGLSQIEAANITGMVQSEVSQLRNYKLKKISLELLMRTLVSLGLHVEIVVRPAHKVYGQGITVVE